MGALFAVGLVLLVLGAAGRLPAIVSVSDKGFALGYVADAEDTAEKAAGKTKEAAELATARPERSTVQTAVAAAENPAQAKQALASLVVPQIVEKLPTNPEEFLPDTTAQMRAVAQRMA
jgi:hypothetical protein